MKLALVLVVFAYSTSFSQESKIRSIRQVTTQDSTVQVSELTVFNNSRYIVCLQTSIQFLSHILSSDSVELAPVSEDLVYFKLGLAEDDKFISYNELPQHYIFLLPRTSFVSTLKMVVPSQQKRSRIEFKYVYLTYDEFKKIFAKVSFDKPISESLFKDKDFRTSKVLFEL